MFLNTYIRFFYCFNTDQFLPLLFSSKRILNKNKKRLNSINVHHVTNNLQRNLTFLNTKNMKLKDQNMYV